MRARTRARSRLPQPFEECYQCPARTICSPASPFPKAIPTRSATRSPTRSSTRSSRTTSSSASPTTAWSIRVSAARRCAPPTRSSSPAKAAARRRCSSKYGDKAVVNRELITEIARDVVKDIGYDQDGFSYHGADVEVLLHGQSPDIAMGVDAKKKKGGEEEGAGDQGMMFGFACTESEVYEKGSYMPAPIYLRAQDPEGALRAAPLRQAVRPAARRQEPGDGAVRRRQGGRLHQGRGLDAAQCARAATARSTRPAWSRT